MNCKTTIITLIITTTFISAWGQTPPRVHMSPIGEAYAGTSVNTAVFRANSVTSHNGHQYAAYYDSIGRVVLARRPHGTDNWTIHPTQYRGRIADAHNVISIATDADGYLHVAFDHHGNSLHYARSTAPETLILGDLQPMTGSDETDVTYPEFHTLPDGTLLFVYRSGHSGGGNMVINRYDTATATWQRMHTVLLDGEGERNAYWQLCTDSHGIIHLSWVWRETWMVETNHDICYARSTDGGITWERTDGTPYTLPITAETAETAWPVPQGSDLINQTSMCADADGHPVVATYWRSEGDTIPQYRIVRHDGKQWHMSTVGHRTLPFTLAGGGTKMIPIARPRVLADEKNIYMIFRDAERGSRVSVASSNDNGAGWQIFDLTDSSVDAWEPSVDPIRWATDGLIDIYVQQSSQGDGERTTETPPQMVYIMELRYDAEQ